jgi:hypothetical protein
MAIVDQREYIHACVYHVHVCVNIYAIEKLRCVDCLRKGAFAIVPARAESDQSSHSFIYTLVKKIPGGPRMQVFAVTIGSLALCAVPVFWKQEKQGHDLFSQEKPEAVRANEEKLQKQHRLYKQSQQQEK